MATTTTRKPRKDKKPPRPRKRTKTGRQRRYLRSIKGMELPPAMRRVPGRLLYKLRTDAGLTLKALARLTGLAWSSHWRWENDKAPVLPYQYEAVKSLVDKWRKAHPIKKPGKVTLRTV